MSQNGESGVVRQDSNRVYIFDTTLRDGEQSPGATMNVDEKIEVAKQLARMGVDIIEAGFPISSEGDFEAVKRIAQEVKGPVIAGLARARKQDIDRCWEAVSHNERPRIHVFISSSDIHLQHLFKLTREEALVQTREMVAYARTLCQDVEFSAQDSTRSELDYLCQMVQEAVSAGATTVNLPDTVGFTTPDEYERMVLTIRSRVKGIENVIISVHCHNDLGMAVANSLTALRAGARQVECTINGIGERAGNAALEEIVMALNTRGDFFNLWTGVDTSQILRSSRMVSSFTGIPVQPNKAIVGSNAFAHESGIHQDGILKERTTYEIMDAAAVGAGSTNLVLGKHSGRHAFKKKLHEMGYNLDGEELNRAFFEFKQLCDKKKVVTDREIEAIVIDQVQNDAAQAYRLEQIQFTSGDKSIPTATLKVITTDGTVLSDSATGDGAVDAVCAAINRMTGINCTLDEFMVAAVTKGIDSVGEVQVKVSYKGRTVSGRGASTDIVVASARAYLQAVNKFAEMGDFADESGKDPYRRDEFGPLAGISRAYR
jgi:2-isopropylmalate synthase